MKSLSRILCCIVSIVLLIGCVPMNSVVSFAAKEDWVGSWGSPAVDSSITLLDSLEIKDVIPANSTVRTVITPTLSGTKVRLKFSNEYGNSAITINKTTIAYTGKTNDIVDKKSITPITFNGGKQSVTIAAGSEVYSDEISFKITALQKVSISCYYKNTTTLYTTGLYGGISYLASSLGDRTNKESMTAVATRLDFTASSITYHTIPFLSRLDVYAPDSYCVAVIGDSTVTNDIYLYLAEKCIKGGVTNVGFIMSGIIGNALNRDGAGMLGTSYGVSLTERFKRDSIDIPNCKYVILKIGVNDILHPMLDSMQGVLPPCSAGKVISGYKTLAEQFKNSDAKVYLCTRTPYKGYTRNFLGSDDLQWSQAGEDKLLEINNWIKTYCTDYGYDGYIDLDAIRDEKDSAKLRSHMTTDGVHFSPYGQYAVTDLIPEASFGVNTELKDYAAILGVNPYVAPAGENTTIKPAETTTKKTAETTTVANNDKETTTVQAQQSTSVITGKPSELTTFSTGNLVIADPTTFQNNANQILIGDDYNGVEGVENVTDGGSKANKKLIGFILLAVVAAIIVSVATLMLGDEHSPIKSSLGRASYNGRAKQKKKV